MQPPNQFSNPRRFVTAIEKLDSLNAQDPNKIIHDGVLQPRELVYAQRLTDWVLRLQPDASEALRLAARSQHLCRWMLPRETYPMTRAGYLRWREELKKFHAQKAAEVLREVGYKDETVQRVQSLNLKNNFPQDPETRILEDALCLLFLEGQAADLARKTGEAKMVNALQKAWHKMTPRAHSIALALPHPPQIQALLKKALASAPDDSSREESV